MSDTGPRGSAADADSPPRHRGRPPAPDGLPVVGNTLAFLRDPLALQERVVATGRANDDVARVRVGWYDAVTPTHPDLVERVLVTDHQQYRKGGFTQARFESLLGDGLIVADGDAWRRGRETLQPAFFRDRVREYAPAMASAAADAVDGWTDGGTVPVRDAMSRTTLAALTRALFDLDGRAAGDRVAPAMEGVLGRFSPGLGAFTPEWVPIPRNRRYRRAIADLDALIDEVVAERRAAAEDGDRPEDLLSVLLSAGFDDAFVRDQLMTMLLAGHETTALTLSYALHLLGTHPDARDRLEAEVDAVVDDDGPPTAADCADLTDTGRVVDEAMRLYPPVWVLFRETADAVDLGGYRLQEGTLVSLPQWALHRDPRWYDDPEAFRPDRWADDADRPRFAFFPFGGGPRACIGEAFARMEAKLVLATVARRYRLDPLYDGLDLSPAITTQPGHEMRMRVRARS